MSLRHTLDSVLAKGKEKYREYSSSRPQDHQVYPAYANQPPPNQYYSPQPNQQYYNPPPNQQYPPPNQYQSPPPQGYPLQQQYFPPQNQGYPPQNQSYPPPSPYNQPPQSPYAPPIPQQSKPNASGGPPSIPHKPTTNTYWQATFSPSVPVSHNFRHELGAHGWGNNEAQNYTDLPSNSFHTPSNQLIIRASAQHGTHTSARLTSHQTLSRSRGYLSVRIKAPSAEGVWPAFWLLPKDPFSWPTDGEVDIMESWNGDPVNHSCLHWGHFNGEDWNKHRVVDTPVHDLAHVPHTYGFAWQEEDTGDPQRRGKLVWYLDGRPVMKGSIPPGTRRMEEFRIIVNVAMGGNVCQGKLPMDGEYELVMDELRMCEAPSGGWEGFERDWYGTPEGHAM